MHEHVASLLPFKVLEAVADKPLRIAGVAMAAGMSAILMFTLLKNWRLLLLR